MTVETDLRAEELMYDSGGTTVAVEKVNGILQVRCQDDPYGEPVIFDLHSVAPMLLSWIVNDEKAVAHRQGAGHDYALWGMIDHILHGLFPDRYPSF